MNNFKLINLDNIKKNKYLIDEDGKIFDIEQNIFLEYNISKGIIGLEDNLGNLVFYIKDELLMRVFVPCLFEGQTTMQVSMINHSDIETIRESNWRL